MRTISVFLSLLNHPVNKNNKLKTIIRIFWWKINQIFLHIPAVIEIEKGIYCYCTPFSSYGGLVVYNKLPEYPEMRFMLKNLNHGDTFFDVGANMGIYTLLAASKIRSKTIYSFEPIPRVLNQLRMNLSLNNLLENVKVIEKVVSDKNGYEKFLVQDITEYSHITYHKSRKGITIPSITLDNYCKKQGIENINLIKIDVEGAEFKVLKGMRKLLKNHQVSKLIVELAGNSIKYDIDHQDIVNYLNKFDYQTFKLNERLQLTEVDQVSNSETFYLIALLREEVKLVKKRLNYKLNHWLP